MTKKRAHAEPPAAVHRIELQGAEPGASPEAVKARVARDISSAPLAAYRVMLAIDGPGPAGKHLDSLSMVEELRRRGEVAAAGDTAELEATLVAQSVALQSMFARLTERAMQQEHWPHLQGFMTLALKAQAQSRLCIEAVLNAKAGPTVFAKQANIAQGGPQQVVNHAPAGTAPGATLAPARETQVSHNQLNGAAHVVER